MNIVSPPPEQCPACGNTACGNTGPRPYTFRACAGACVRVNNRLYLDVSESVPREMTPHLHVQCDVCQFEWLQPVTNLDEFRRVW